MCNSPPIAGGARSTCMHSLQFTQGGMQVPDANASAKCVCVTLECFVAGVEPSYVQLVQRPCLQFCTKLVSELMELRT